MSQDAIQSTKFGLVDINSVDGVTPDEVQILINNTLNNAPSITTQILQVGTPSSNYELPTILPIGTQIIVNRLLPSIVITDANNTINYFVPSILAFVITISNGTYDLAGLLTEIINKTTAFLVAFPSSVRISWTTIGNNINVSSTGNTYSIVMSPLTITLGQTINFALTNSYTFVNPLPAAVEWDNYNFAADDVTFNNDLEITGNLDVGEDITCNNLNMSGVITSSNPSDFTITQDNAVLDLNTNLISMNINGSQRIYATDTASAIVSPDGFTGIAVENGTIFEINASGAVFYSDPTLTYMSDQTGAGVVSVTATEIAASVPVILNSEQNVAAPDLAFSDSANTGIFSPTTGDVGISASGLLVAEFLASVPGNAAPVLFNEGIAQQVAGSKLETANSSFTAGQSPSIIAFNSCAAQTNIQMTRTNGTYALPTQVVSGNNLGNIGCRGYLNTGALSTTTASIQFKALENYATTTNQGSSILFNTTAIASGALATQASLTSIGLGIGVTTPAAKLDLSGASGTTFKMVDTNQALGKVMTSSAAGVGSWADPNTLTFASGYCYFEAASTSGTAIATAVTSTQYLINLASTSVNLTNFTSNSLSRLTYTGTPTKVFRVNCSASIANNSGILPQQFNLWGRKNGSAITGSSGRLTTDTSTTDFFTAAFSYTISLATNDYIECYISNETGTVSAKIGSLQISIM